MGQTSKEAALRDERKQGKLGRERSWTRRKWKPRFSSLIIWGLKGEKKQESRSQRGDQRSS